LDYSLLFSEYLDILCLEDKKLDYSLFFFYIVKRRRWWWWWF